MGLIHQQQSIDFRQKLQKVAAALSLKAAHPVNACLSYSDLSIWFGLFLRDPQQWHNFRIVLRVECPNCTKFGEDKSRSSMLKCALDFTYAAPFPNDGDKNAL